MDDKNRTDERYPFQQPVFEEEGIDIKKYIFLILSHWWWFAISVFVSLTIAYLVNRYSQEVFNVSSSVIVGEPEASSTGVDNLLDELSRFKGKRRKAVVENEISILKSYKLARMALEELDFGITYTAVGRRNIAEKQLYHNCPFKVIPDSGKWIPWGTYYVTIISVNKYILGIGEEKTKELSFGEYYDDNQVRFKIVLRNPESFKMDAYITNKYFFVFNNMNTLTNAYRNALNVDVNDDKGSILTLSMNGYVPEKIATYLNKISEVYIRLNLEEKNIASVNTIRFIDNQLSGVVDSLHVTGRKLQQFRSANKVINLSTEGTYLFGQLQELQSEAVKLDMQGRYYKYLLEYIEDRNDFSDVVAPSIVGIQDELLNSLVGKLNEFNMERRNLNFVVAENSPQIEIINNQIRTLQSALKENLNSLINTNAIRKQELRDQIAKNEKQIRKLPGTERQLIDIEREFTINDQIYTFLLEKRAEAGITRASNTSNHKILDIANAENATFIKPNTSRNYMFGLILGGMIPLILLVIVEFFNDKVENRNDIEQRTNVPILGSVGHNDKESEIPVFEAPKSALAESFRALRTNLQFNMHENPKGVISVSSTISGEGKTFCAINLASIIAMAGKKTLLVSLDLRRPKVHRIFNISNEVGLSTYLINKTPLEEVIHTTNIDNLFIATAGPIPPNPAELIGSKQMKKFFDEVSSEYENIILDTPPVGIVTDALLLDRFIDTHIFVIRYNYTRKQAIQLVDELFNKKGFKNLSLLVNDVQVRGYYGYNSGYSYGYGYGYGYNYYKQGYYEDDNMPVTFWDRIIGRFK